VEGPAYYLFRVMRPTVLAMVAIAFGQGLHEGNGQKPTFIGDKRGSDILLPFANSAVDNKKFIPVVRSPPSAFN